MKRTSLKSCLRTSLKETNSCWSRRYSKCCVWKQEKYSEHWYCFNWSLTSIFWIYSTSIFLCLCSLVVNRLISQPNPPNLLIFRIPTIWISFRCTLLKNRCINWPQIIVIKIVIWNNGHFGTRFLDYRLIWVPIFIVNHNKRTAFFDCRWWDLKRLRIWSEWKRFGRRLKKSNFIDVIYKHKR